MLKSPNTVITELDFSQIKHEIVYFLCKFGQNLISQIIQWWTIYVTQINIFIIVIITQNLYN